MNHRHALGHRPLLALLVASVFAVASASAQTSKPAQHNRMVELQAQIDASKGQPGADAQQLAANQAELAQISADLGGDVPCATGGAIAGTSAVRVPAPSPTGCVPTTTSFPNTTAVAIPTGPAVVTSTITVAGAAAYLWDVDLTTFITHTFNADLDVTLQSPAGTIVTLTSDNGAGNDNVFNGTVWDDDANPAGQVPYTSNNGVVTDHVYANLTLASPLVAEEALAAFVGENPNGIWTLTISDDLAGDGGSLDQWSLNLTTFATAPTAAAAQSFNQTTPVAIPTGPAVAASTLAVAGLTNSICKAIVRTNIAHTFAADLDITLLSPSGTIVTLTTDNGVANDNVFAGTVWDDDANPAGQVPYVNNQGIVTDHLYANLVLASPLVVEEAMGAFMGEVGNGTWTLTVSDDLAGDGGSIDSWGLDLITCSCAAGAGADLALTQSNNAPVSGLLVGDTFQKTLTVTNNGPSAATGITVTDTLPSQLIFVSSNCGATAAGQVVTYTIPTLAIGAVNNCVLTVRVNSTGTIVNTAAITASTPADPTPANNTTTQQIGPTGGGVVPAADLALTQSNNAAGNALLIGNTFQKTLTVTNNGPLTATAITVTDTLPAQLTFVSSTCGATAAGQVVTYTIATLASAAVNNCVLTLRITAPGTIVNTAAITASAPADPNLANNTTTAQIGAPGGGVAQTAVPALDRNMVLVLLGLVSVLGMLALRQRQG